MHYFYVLQSEKKKDWFYKGSTPDLKIRVDKHNSGQVTATKPFRPLKLVYYEAYLTKKSAIAREISVKNGGSTWKPLMKRIHQSLEE